MLPSIVRKPFKRDVNLAPKLSRCVVPKPGYMQWRHRSAGGPLTDLGLGPPPVDPNQCHSIPPLTVSVSDVSSVSAIIS